MSDTPEVINYSNKEDMRENDGPDLNNISKNKKASKKREFNDYSKLTGIVRSFKRTNDDKYLLEAIKCLEGLINTFTIIIAPGDSSQQIAYMNTYMKQFLYMFLSPDEKGGDISYTVYMQAIYRIRWIMRRYDYEDVYSFVVSEIIKNIKSMKIIETNNSVCQCFYYIQMVVKYAVRHWIIRNTKDAMIHANESSENEDSKECFNDDIDVTLYHQNDLSFEDEFINSIYNNIDIDILTSEEGVYKIFSPYEKYILYLHDYLELTFQNICNILKYEEKEELIDVLKDIVYKLELINNEEI